MAFNFPDAPNVNDVFSAAGVDYVWSGYAWLRLPLIGAPLGRREDQSVDDKLAELEARVAELERGRE
jgi:hypothetical protein